MSGNIPTSENVLLQKAVEALQARLPPGWGATRLPFPNGGRPDRTPGAWPPDGAIRVQAPDGRAARLLVEVKGSLEPRQAQQLAVRMREAVPTSPLLVIARWMSSTTREILAAQRISALDLTGNLCVTLSEPGLFIDARGADRDPWPDGVQTTLRGAKAGLVVRALCRSPLPIGVRALAAMAGTTPGYVSKLVHMLDAAAAIRRTPDGQVGEVDLSRLLHRWASDAPLGARAARSTWIAPRGVAALRERLASTKARYAVTGSLAAALHAPVAPPRILSIYVEDPDEFARVAELQPAEAGINVVLLVASDPGAFDGVRTVEGLRVASLPLVVADLLSGPGREPAEGEALLAWMQQNPEVWRN